MSDGETQDAVIRRQIQKTLFGFFHSELAVQDRLVGHASGFLQFGIDTVRSSTNSPVDNYLLEQAGLQRDSEADVLLGGFVGNPDGVAYHNGKVEADVAIYFGMSIQAAFPGGFAPQGAGRLRDPKTGRFIPDPANPPSPNVMTDAQRRAHWKQLAQDPNSPLTAAQRAEIKARGWRGPQRLNEFGELETMELSHEPIPLRDGGKDVVPHWPADHAAIDPHRQLKKRP